MEYSLRFVSREIEWWTNAMEAVLFASGDPVPRERFAELFDITKVEVDLIADALEARLSARESSFDFCRLADAFQICTKAEYADVVQRFLEIKRTAPLSKAALEALSIVAYKQPVTKTYIEQVRGVDCTAIITTLMQRSLIEECGRLDAPGRPILYQTTPDFLRCFGLSDLEELPGENPVQLKLGAEETDAPATEV